MTASTDAQQRIAAEAMDLIDHIEGFYGTDFTLGTIAIVVDVVASRDGDNVNPVVYECSDARRWVQAALLREALDGAEIANEAREHEATEED